MEIATLLRPSPGACGLFACAVLAALTLFAASPASGKPAAQVDRRWKPVADEVYLQEVGSRIVTDKPVTAIAVLKGVAYAVVDGSAKAVRGDGLQDTPGSPTGITRLRSLDGALWAATPSGAYRYDGSAWRQVDAKPFVDFCMHVGQVYGATRDDAFRYHNGAFVNVKPEGGYLSSGSTVVMEDFSQVLADPVLIGPVDRIGSYSGTLYVLRPGSIGLIDGKTFVPDPVDWGALPSPRTRDMLPLGSALYVATDRGLGVLRGMAMTTLKGSDGLPYEDVTCLAEGFADDLWIGTTRGAIRKVGDAYHYFGAENWLPGDRVNAIAAGDRAVYVATDQGLGIVRYEPYTLAKKAAWFEREMDEWGFLRLGFVHRIGWSDEHKEYIRHISDNDGGHTSPYLAALCFKYAVTGDESARREAVESFNAMAWLQDITGIPGFFARAIWSVQADKGRRDNRGSGGLPAKWYTTDDGLWVWKGDTSSDEVNAHFYSVSLFHDLVAKGREKERARDHLARIAKHIIDNGWVLRDKDGKPTRWGRWDPNYLHRPYGFEAAGLNGMEAQTYMVTAHTLTGDPVYQQGLGQLIKWRYHTYTVRQRLIFPPDNVVPWDDTLAFKCYLPLLTYCKDPYLRSIYLRSIARTWEVLRIQRLPWFNFTYGALTGNDCEAPQAVQQLRDYPLDLENRAFDNSHRADLATLPGYVQYSIGSRSFSARETGAAWGSAASFRMSGGRGRSVSPPVGWLQDYWMGRYYGFIEAPRTKDPKLTTIAPRAEKRKGAPAYSGPARPVAK